MKNAPSSIYPKMRRIKKQLLDVDARRIIDSAGHGVLSLCSDTYPYGVPLSPVLYENNLYFHCANSGFKLDIIEKNPNGHFVFIAQCDVARGRSGFNQDDRTGAQRPRD